MSKFDFKEGCDPFERRKKEKDQEELISESEEPDEKKEDEKNNGKGKNEEQDRIKELGDRHRELQKGLENTQSEEEREKMIDEIKDIEEEISLRFSAKDQEISREEKFKSLQSAEEFNPDQIKNIIQDVIDEEYLLFDVERMADYDADFSGKEPYFINIWSKQKGYNFGYIVFHDFLRRVGEQNTFLSTDFTQGGSKLFQKAVEDNLIEKVSDSFGLQRLTRWRVINDPVKNLEKIKKEVDEF